MEKPIKEILITYSSGYGATKEIAEEIARVLNEQLECNITSKSIHECDTINNYDAIVLGSSIRADRPLANARDFFSIHRYDLGQKNAVFGADYDVKVMNLEDAAGNDKQSQLVRRQFNVLAFFTFIPFMTSEIENI